MMKTRWAIHAAGLGLALAAALAAGQAAAGDAAAGEARYKQGCVNSHGKAGQGMASFPSLAGRDAAYISDRLTSYRARESVGPNSALMYSWAGPLSDEEIANIAAYVSTSFR